MTTSSPLEGVSPERATPYQEKVWTVHLRAAIRTPARGWPFLQLPPGEYKLYERTDVHYELRASEDFSCHFRLSEIEAMVSAGDLIIEGRWPE
jgi:hypothetical protein